MILAISLYLQSTQHVKARSMVHKQSKPQACSTQTSSAYKHVSTDDHCVTKHSTYPAAQHLSTVDVLYGQECPFVRRAHSSRPKGSRGSTSIRPCPYTKQQPGTKATVSNGEIGSTWGYPIESINTIALRYGITVRIRVFLSGGPRIYTNGEQNMPIVMCATCAAQLELALRAEPRGYVLVRVHFPCMCEYISVVGMWFACHEAGSLLLTRAALGPCFCPCAFTRLLLCGFTARCATATCVWRPQSRASINKTAPLHEI